MSVVARCQARTLFGGELFREQNLYFRIFRFGQYAIHGVPPFHFLRRPQ